jgi:PAS domain S-box-containing protein
MGSPARSAISEASLERLLGLESSKIGFYSEVKQKIRELESTNLDLRTKKNELQAVFDAIGDGVAIFDARARVQVRNHVCPRLFPTETLVGKHCGEIFHTESPSDPEHCPVERALTGESCQVAFSVDRGGRQTHYFEATATPIEDPMGQPTRALIFLRDVTERRLQELLLLQAEKMSSVGVLAAGVAHEINNPLTSVGGYAEALLRRLRERPVPSDDPEWDVFPRYLEVIVREAHRCKAIIESLLSFSRKSDGAMGTVDLKALVHEVLQLLHHRARYEEVEISERIRPDLPPLRGDAAGLRQVVLNLVLNALQAIEGSGAVEIQARQEGDLVLLEVRDTGCGIPQDVLEQIWDPFFTTKKVGHGLGLGLSVTYNIVRRHGGRIQVESRPGQGSKFTVSLPLQQEPL